MQNKWFNVLNGAFPGFTQVQRVLPVAAGETGIGWGTPVYQDGQYWKAATASVKDDPLATIWYALMSQDDMTSRMAGTLGDQPVIGAISGDMIAETTEFKSDEVYTDGQLLTVGAGVLAPHTSGDNVVAQVIEPKQTKYLNMAEAVSGMRTGANKTIIVVRTMWIPKMVTA